MQYNPELYPDLGKSMRVYARDNGIFALMRGTGKFKKSWSIRFDHKRTFQTIKNII